MRMGRQQSRQYIFDFKAKRHGAIFICYLVRSSSSFAAPFCCLQCFWTFLIGPISLVFHPPKHPVTHAKTRSHSLVSRTYKARENKVNTRPLIFRFVIVVEVTIYHKYGDHATHKTNQTAVELLPHVINTLTNMWNSVLCTHIKHASHSWLKFSANVFLFNEWGETNHD